MSITPVPTSGALYDILISHLPRISSEERQAVWEKYLQSSGLTENPDATPQVQASLSTYVRLVADKDLTLAPPYFIDTIHLLFGDIATEMTQALWEKFMEEYKYVLPPDENSAEIKKQFVESLVRRYDELVEKIAVSPEEAIKRQLMFNVFDIITLLMKTFQDNVFVLQQLINVYSKHELEYTKQMSRMFFLKRGNPLNNVSATGGAVTTAENFGLGYGNLNLQEVIEYVLAQKADFGIGTHYTKFSESVTNPNGLHTQFPELNSAPYIFKYEDPNLADPPPAEPTDDRFFHFFSPFYGNLFTVQFDKDDPFEEVVAQCGQAFIDAYNQNPYLTFTTTALEAAVARSVLGTNIAMGNTVVDGTGRQFTLSGGNAVEISPEEFAINDFIITHSIYGVSEPGLPVGQKLVLRVTFDGDETEQERVDEIMAAIDNLFATTPDTNLQNEILDPGITVGGVYTNGVQLQTILNRNQPVGPFGLQNQFYIPWIYTADTDSANSIRGSKNSLYQQYIEATRAKREAIADRSEAVESILDSSNQAIRGFVSILDGSLKQLRTVIDKLFKAS